MTDKNWFSINENFRIGYTVILTVPENPESANCKRYLDTRALWCIRSSPIIAETWKSLSQASCLLLRDVPTYMCMCVSIPHIHRDECSNQLWKSPSSAHACTSRNQNAHSSRTHAHTRPPFLLAPVVPLKIRIQGQWFIKLLLSRKCHAKGTLLRTDANSGLSHGAIEELCTWCSARIQAVRFQSSPRLITAVSTLPAEIGRDGKYPQNTFFTFPPAVFNLSYEPVLNCFHVNLTLFLLKKKKQFGTLSWNTAAASH